MNKIKYLLAFAGLVLLSHGLLGYFAPNNFDPASYIQKRQQYDVRIKRDIWGVPHIEGKRDADTAFGFAYAQAEDHYTLIEDVMWLYRGQQSAKSGYESIPIDYLIQLLEIRTFVDQKYATDLSDEVKETLTAFADGLNYWAATHVDQVEQSLYPITAKDLAASFSLQHLMMYGLQNPIGELFKEERKHKLSLNSSQAAWQLVADEPLPMGSNAFAISPRRSDDGSTRMLINSHQPLTGPVAWYEAHLKSEQGLHVMGGTFPGSPFIMVGTNEHVAWGATVNHPDLVDIYVLTINPENNDQYLLDGEWRDFKIKQAQIKIKLFGNFYWTINEDLYYSEHGPVIRRDHGDYAIRYAGRGEIRQPEQWLAMNKATGLASWQQAMNKLAISSFNFVAADKDGNIGFVHNSQSPIRKQGFNWSEYLPGDRSDLIWQEYLPFDQLPQVTNPDSGYLLSTNQSPFRVTAAEDNVARSDYPESFGFPTRMTNRATRGLELFDANTSISEAEFKAIKYDNKYSKNARAMKYLFELFEVNYAPDSIYFSALEHLKSWDLATNMENTAASLGVCTISEEWLAEQAHRPAPSVQDEFEKCVDIMIDQLGSVTVPWGDVNRIIRGELNLPVNGGPDVMRAIYGRGLEKDGYITASAGDGLYIFVSWDKDGHQTIESMHQFGSATTLSSSSHYADQMEKYVAEETKQTFFHEASLADNIERSYVP